MKLIDVIRALSKADGNSIELDEMIAPVMGFRQKVMIDPANASALTRRRNWYIPGVSDKLFYFTKDIDSAVKLVEFLAPGEAFGVSWEKTTASARVGSSPYFQAAAPAIALCMAALARKLQKDAQFDHGTD